MQYINPHGKKFTVVPYEAEEMTYGIRASLALLPAEDTAVIPHLTCEISKRSHKQLRIEGCALYIGDDGVCVDGRKEYLTRDDKDLTLVPGPYANTFYIQGVKCKKWLTVDTIVEPTLLVTTANETKAVFFTAFSTNITY